MAAYDDLNVKRIFTVGVFSIAVTAVTALGAEVLYYRLVQWQEAETRAASDYRRQNRILREQTEQISTYGVDPNSGNIIIPIEKAMELYVAEQKANSATDVTNAEKSGSDET
jgi:hypothetical protein